MVTIHDVCLEYGVFNFLKCGDLSWGLFSQLDMFLYENLVSVDYATPGNFLVICGMRCYMQTLLICHLQVLILLDGCGVEHGYQ